MYMRNGTVKWSASWVIEIPEEMVRGIKKKSRMWGDIAKMFLSWQNDIKTQILRTIKNPQFKSKIEQTTKHDKNQEYPSRTSEMQWGEGLNIEGLKKFILKEIEITLIATPQWKPCNLVDNRVIFQYVPTNKSKLKCHPETNCYMK